MFQYAFSGTHKNSPFYLFQKQIMIRLVNMRGFTGVYFDGNQQYEIIGKKCKVKAIAKTMTYKNKVTGHELHLKGLSIQDGQGRASV